MQPQHLLHTTDRACSVADGSITPLRNRTLSRVIYSVSILYWQENVRYKENLSFYCINLIKFVLYKTYLYIV